ncbi:MAG: hypothetical protein AAF518_13930 [Spirochaetota bacterium]
MWSKKNVSKYIQSIGFLFLLNACVEIGHMTKDTRSSIVPGTEKPFVYKGHIGVVNLIEVSPDGNYFVSAGKDKEIRVWDMKGALLQTLRGHKLRVESLAISPDGKQVYTFGGFGSGLSQSWSLSGEKDVSLGSQIDSGDYSQNSKYIITSTSREIVLRDSAGKRLKYLFTEKDVKVVRFTPDSRHFIYAEGNTIYLNKLYSSVSAGTTSQRYKIKYDENRDQSRVFGGFLRK